MAARKTPNVRKPTTKPKAKTPTKPKAQPFKNPNVLQGKEAIQASYGNQNNSIDGVGGVAFEGTSAVMEYYNSLPRKERKAAYAAVAKAIQGRDLSKWSGDPGNIALFGELDPKAREAYAAGRGMTGSGGGGGTGLGGGETLADSGFTTGVSGATGAFITEKGGKGPAGDAAEGGATKDNTKQKKAQRKKLVKRAVKKTNVKGKAIRRALRSPGVTKSDKKVYAKVAKQATPKLSSRLRVADRRKGK